MKKLLSLCFALMLFVSIAAVPASASIASSEQTVTAKVFMDTLVAEYAKYGIRIIPGEYDPNQVITVAELNDCLTTARAEGLENLALSQTVIDLGSVYASENNGIVPFAYSNKTMTSYPTYATLGPAGSIDLKVSVLIRSDASTRHISSASNVNVTYRGGVGYTGCTLLSSSTSINNNTSPTAPHVTVTFTLDMTYQMSPGGLPVTQIVTRSFSDIFYPFS